MEMSKRVNGLPENVFYDGAGQGITQRATGKPTVYYGVIVRHDRGPMNDKDPDDPEFEKTERQAIKAMREKTTAKFGDSFLYDGVMERKVQI